MHSIFQISISRNAKCAHKVGFRKSSHILLIFAINQPLLNIGRNAHKDDPQTELEAYTEATL